MKISDILKVKGSKVFTISPEAPTVEAIKMLCENKIGALIVTDNSGIKGIITERDILLNCEKCIRSETKVRNVMTGDVIIGLPEDEIEDVMRVMTQKKIRHLPVMGKDGIIGVISIGDILKSIHEQKNAEIHYLKSYIAGDYMN